MMSGEQGVAVNTTIERPDGINLYVVYTDSNTHDRDDTTHHLFLF
jgi:hypothetical protein